ncbi:Mucin-associated surface protein (MASP), putative, partial [Trypanosoma cruzi]
MKTSNTNSVNIPHEMVKSTRKTKMLMVKMQPQLRTTVTAAPRSPTPPPLFCLLLLRVRLLLRWWPR